MTLSIERLRREAKALKRAWTAGDADAQVRVAAVQGARDEIRHADALHVVAREQGYQSWPKLKIAVGLAGLDRTARAETLKVALYLGQGWMVDHLLDDDPSLAEANFGLSVALYRLDIVADRLARDPEAATRMVGVRSPILHLAFSKHHRKDPDRAAASVAVGELLVDHGAEVNDSYPAEPGSEHRLSALYGALGHGGNLPLAAWLLEQGATPDDNESLYHATELGHLDGVRLLMKHGVKTSGTNALARMLDFDDQEGLRLFLEYGADPNAAVLDHPSGQPIDTIPALHQAARRGRDGRFAKLLLDHGADPDRIWHGRTPYEWAAIYGNTSFADAMAEAGHDHALDPVAAAVAACARGEVPEGRPLAQTGLDDEVRRILTRGGLWEDRLDHAKAVVAAGSDPNVTEEMGMPPVHLTGWAGLTPQAAWLLTLNPDLTHVNDYGGGLVGTIIHGSENRLDTEERDHVGCMRLALEAGAKIHQSDIDGAMDEDMVAFLHDWVEAHPDSLIKE